VNPVAMYSFLTMSVQMIHPGVALGGGSR